MTRIPRGSLAQLAGRRGCVSERHKEGCARGRALGGAASVATSPDGRNVYVASNTSYAVVSFARDQRTGALSQLAGRAGCTSEGGKYGCAVGRGLIGAFSVAISPDGRNVYVASYSGVVAFSRQPATGALSQLPGSAACVLEGGGEGCASGRGLDGASSVTVSPDGKNVYVASTSSNAVAVFARDRTTGALRQLEGPAGCTDERGNDNCQLGRGLAGAFSVAVPLDGRHVYVVSLSSNAIVRFGRDPVGGELTEENAPTACTSERGTEGCTTGRAILGPNALAIAPDGGHVYVASSESSSVAVLLRERTTGVLDQLPGTYACTSERGSGGCSPGRGLGGSFALGMNPKATSLYVASQNSVVVFSRHAANGRIAQLSGRRGCVDEYRREGCAGGRGLAGAASVAVSPDGRNVYVAALQSNAVAVFKRRPDAVTLRASLSGIPRGCASRGFTVRAGARATLKLRSLRLALDRRLIARSRGRSLRRRIRAGRLPRGRHRLRLVVIDVGGNRASRTMTFSRCR